ncbi:polysaccharide pyruvyl transferase family protein [Microvirga flavescens]|uniref:polysaccharide pyruvyl transferase family protein n=1 Tax=Microvirga flavescens TaxID=2249811 RepID=UPI000DD5623F|nr:polysaccharide pyruvyl transferase family protein [Microvirga flavescens]
MKHNPIEFLRERFGTDRRYRYMPNGGNLGDNLIAAGTVQSLDRSGLNWEFMHGGRETVSEKDVLIYGGGGSFVDLYQGGIDCLRFLLSLGQPVVVLPQTVRGHEEFWRSCPNITLFCRDQKSFDYASSFSQVDVLAADDMALSLDLSDPLLAGILEYHAKIRARNPGARRVLNAFRGDTERSSSAASASDSIDLSELVHPRISEKTDIYANAVLFLMSVAGFDLVRTDRLHVSVAASLVGIDVELFDNNYGKNSDIFRFSLREKFSSMQLMGLEKVNL